MDRLVEETLRYGLVPPVVMEFPGITAGGAVGSMGVATLVELQLQKARKYVETTYHPVSDMPDAIKKIEEMTADPSIDYVDGIMFSKKKGAIITGRLTDTPTENTPVQRFSSASDPWFYMHVESSLDKGSDSKIPPRFAIPLAEYLFRI
ncbi:hypothetical protein EYC84_009218 [Monilinia fructicola]|uniref:Uncharacterized protein n=1 Tax=Monilinia fructicola TaxID=38448 RepID=A0A5M9JBG9_MONFR|nr:hypothetical protein EYC84_009218 [Monilinia fructicola]